MLILGTFSEWNARSVSHYLDLAKYSSEESITTFSNNAVNSSNTIAVSTASPELLLLNSATGKLLKQTVTPSPITHLMFSHTNLLSGSTDGFIRAHDIRVPDFGQAISAVQAHAMGIQSFDVSGNFIFTIGWGVRYVYICIVVLLPT